MKKRMRGWALALVLSLAAAGASGQTATDDPPRYLIYLHGRIVQERQSARPHNERFGYYELEQILDTFRKRGFVVSGEIRPKAVTESESAHKVVAQVRKLIASGVSPDHITVVGASMGAAITFLASARLANPDLRFATLGACLSENVQALAKEEKTAPRGHLLAIRESTDDLIGPCAPWNARADVPTGLDAREIVLKTGLSHGFLYRPLPEWVDPVVAWALGSISAPPSQ